MLLHSTRKKEREKKKTFSSTAPFAFGTVSTVSIAPQDHLLFSSSSFFPPSDRRGPKGGRPNLHIVGTCHNDEQAPKRRDSFTPPYRDRPPPLARRTRSDRHSFVLVSKPTVCVSVGGLFFMKTKQQTAPEKEKRKDEEMFFNCSEQRRPAQQLENRNVKIANTQYVILVLMVGGVG